MVLTPVICGSCKSTAEVNLLTTAACGNCGSDDLDFFEGASKPEYTGGFEGEAAEHHRRGLEDALADRDRDATGSVAYGRGYDAGLGFRHPITDEQRRINTERFGRERHASVREAGIMDYYEVVVHRRGDEAGAVEYSSADLADAVRTAEAFYAERERDQAMGPQPGTAISVDVINTGTGDVFWHNGIPNAKARFYSSRRKAAATPYGEIRVWADGFGTWHASVALDDHSINAAQRPEVAAAALEAIRNELHERSNGRTSGGPAAYDPATTGVKFEGASNSPDGQYLAYFVETNIHDASLHEAAKGRYVVRHDKYGDSYHHQTIELARRERDHPQTVPAGEWYIWDRIEKRRVDDDETDQHKQAELGEPERGMCPRCGTAQYNPQAGYCPQCGYRKTGSVTAERGPNGFWCRYCGDYQSVRNPAEHKKMRAHMDAHEKAGHKPVDRKPFPGDRSQRLSSVPDTRTDEWDGTDPLLPFPEPTTFGSLHEAAEWTSERYASPQAWRRLRNTMTAGELGDIASDIGRYANLNPNQVNAITHALTSVDWEAGYHQGSLQTVAYPKGRSSYEPGRSRMGEPTPQTHPHKFSDEDIVAEVKHLMKTNRDYEEAGGNPTDTPNIRRTLAYTKLLRHLSDRKKKRGSLHTATDEEHWLDRARRVSSGQGKGIEHEQIDHVTAGMLTQIHDALSPANQAKFKRMSLEKAVDVGWKLVNRHKSSLQRMAVTDDMLLRTTAVVELTSGEPYGETQVREDIHDGDVFHVADTNIYGVLVEAWPCVLTEKDADDTGMHTFTMSAIDKPENQKYKAAFQEAYRLQGLPFPTTAGLHGAAEQCQFPGCSNAARSSSTYCPVHDVWAQHLRDVNSKLMEITAGILDTNPGMNREAAVRLAATTLERFPKLAGPPPPDVVEDMPHTLQRMVQEFQRNHQQQVAQ